MKYWMMRLFLSRRTAGTLFERIPEQETREAYIRRVFSIDYGFQYRKKPYVFKTFSSHDSEHLMGVVGRPHTILVSGPPEDAFQEHPIRDWETANVFIDPVSAQDGQKVAMQETLVIGLPLSVFRALADHINNINANSDWHISVSPIAKKAEFWSVARLHKNELSEIDLTFITPNMFGGEDATIKALKAFNTYNNADSVVVTLKNSENNLNVDSKNVKQSVDYITKGGGSVKLKGARGNVLYDSESQIVKVSPGGDVPLPTADSASIFHLLKRLFKK